MSASEDRQLPATERQRERFAERGEVPCSRDLSSAVLLCAGAGGAYAGIVEASSRLRQLIRDDYGRLAGGLQSYFFASQMHALGAVLTPIMLSCLAGIAMSAALQTGGRFRFTPVTFNPERLDPLPRIMQLFGFAQASKQIAWSALKIAVLAVITWQTLASRLPTVLGTYPSNLLGALKTYGSITGLLVARCLAALLTIGLGDYAMNWWQLEKRMRMSHHEVREEGKQDSGDPRIRSARRRKHREIVRRNSVMNTKKAHVVLVNPTHYAVALRYDAKSMRAPVVVAKGTDGAAERIRSIAREHNVPVVSQPPLTRLLFARVPSGKAIPPELYQAVALVLAHVYGLRRSA